MLLGLVILPALLQTIADVLEHPFPSEVVLLLQFYKYVGSLKDEST